LKNTIVTSDYRPEVEILPYRACAMKNRQYDPHLMAELPKLYRNSSVFVDLVMGQIQRSTERVSS